MRDSVRTYLDGIGQYPLLTKEDEMRLGQAIEAGRVAAEELAQGRPLSPARERELRRARREAKRASEAFVNANLRLVVSIAKKYQSADMPILDLIQEGNLGLMHAVEKFDWRRGFKFSTYATWWIRQGIGRGIDNTSRTVRLPVHAGDQVRRVLRAKAQLEGQTGQTATAAQLAGYLQMAEADVETLLRYVVEPVSLATPIGADGDTELADVVSDADAPTPFDLVAARMLGGEVDRLLSSLSHRERADPPDAIRPRPRRAPHAGGGRSRAQPDQGAHPPDREERPGEAPSPECGPRRPRPARFVAAPPEPGSGYRVARRGQGGRREESPRNLP